MNLHKWLYMSAEEENKQTGENKKQFLSELLPTRQWEKTPTPSNKNKRNRTNEVLRIQSPFEHKIPVAFSFWIQMYKRVD